MPTTGKHFRDFMIIAQLIIAPVGADISLSSYVKQAIAVLKKHGVKFQTTAMSTIIEIEDLERLFKIVSEAHQAVLQAGAKRVITELKIDDRRDANATMQSKIDAVT